MEDQLYHESDTEERSRDIVGQPGAEDGQVEETWDIHVPTELKRKLASLWQTSIIIKLMGRQLGYRVLQTKLVGIWRLTGKWTLIDIGYGFFIVQFDLQQDYQHALMVALGMWGTITSTCKRGRRTFTHTWQKYPPQ